MRLMIDQLASNLQNRGLSPIYCISGDEPLQVLESADLIRQYARARGFEERAVLNVDKTFDWMQLKNVGANLSLFSTKRFIELRLGSQKPGRVGGLALTEYASELNGDSVLLITIGKLDKQAQQSKWYKSLDKAGTMIQIWPIERSKLSGWLAQRVKQSGKQLSKNAASLIVDKVEGNLLAAKQEVEKLSLIIEKPEIDLKDVMEAVADSARFDVFSLIENTMMGKTERSIRMLRGLKNEGVEPISIFGTLMWEFRRICSMAYEIEAGSPIKQVLANYRVWQQRKAAISSILKRLDVKQFSLMLRLSVILDKAMKGAIRTNAWELLENFIFLMAGVCLHSKETISRYF